MPTAGKAATPVSLMAVGDSDKELPILCDICLGPHEYVRMTRADFDKECKICARPFTVFRWRPGKDARYKKTEVCQTCARLKNVCQTCLLDLEFGLPVQVRDSFIKESEQLTIPKSEVNREWFTMQQEKRFANGEMTVYEQMAKDRAEGLTSSDPNVSALLRLQRTAPYYKRNRPHVCSFFAKGECTRGASCPYRHEQPETGELAHQNMKDRYYGVNDPVAKKMLRRHDEEETKRKEAKKHHEIGQGQLYPAPKDAPPDTTKATFAVPAPPPTDPGTAAEPHQYPSQAQIF
eukprot:TRINITY_DN6772_c0_g1_i1.p2 TRINITY_DN6772_c0_g1~~TRINITY_DN6772_c0_g1_i1.p2  ORF type:complete len:291 (+),score=33.19 TRINITY_DN6772_c0_g1_i1:49-921(+)